MFYNAPDDGPCVCTVGASSDPIFDRCKHLLPQEVDGGAVAGLNARWRLYKYGPQDIFRYMLIHQQIILRPSGDAASMLCILLCRIHVRSSSMEDG